MMVMVVGGESKHANKQNRSFGHVSATQAIHYSFRYYFVYSIEPNLNPPCQIQQQSFLWNPYSGDWRQSPETLLLFPLQQKRKRKIISLILQVQAR